MSFFDLLAFVPLAIITNTAFPYPFEPVLLLVTAGQPPSVIAVYAVLGSLCAGVAAFVDIHIMARVGGMVGRGPRWSPANLHRWWFYLVAFASALLPVPYSIVRVTLARGRPDPRLYAGVVALGRLPRYFAAVYVWHQLRLPLWTTGLLVVAGLPWLFKRRKATDRQAHPALSRQAIPRAGT
jgi:membrane protein YqaA with SNARE-associated domain